jgi:hypothetical protein
MKKETANCRFSAANGSGKRNFVFLGWQIINGYRQLLYEQTCPSVVKNLVTSCSTSMIQWNWRLAQLHRNRNWRLAQLHRNRNWRNRAGQEYHRRLGFICYFQQNSYLQNTLTLFRALCITAELETQLTIIKVFLVTWILS